MSITGKNVFITGGAGFIGSKLIERLIEANKVTVFDNFARDALSRKNYANHPNLKVVRGDVLDANLVEQSMAGANIVVHCAAIAGIDTVTRSPVGTLRVNILGSANVLEAASKLPHCERAVFFSTSEIFGGMAYVSKESDHADIGPVGEPRWTYAAGKLAEEHLAIAYHLERELPAVVLRPFNVYGPDQVGEGAIRNFIRRAVANEPIEIYGDGTQIRAWCFVDDMVDAVVKSLHHPAAVGEAFNIGNARAVATTISLAEAVIRVTGSSSKIQFTPRAGADIGLRIPDTSKAKAKLLFEAKVDLDEGIRRTADAMRAAKA